MSDKIYVGNSAKHITTSPSLTQISKVVLIVGDEIVFEAGDNSGRSVEVKVPWGDQQMANDILAKLQGFQYQPYSAQDAIFDPAAELGDGVTVGGVYSGIYSENIKFDSLVTADIEAPHEEEIDHEYPYKPQKEREYKRKMGEMSSRITQTSLAIEAEVSARENDNNLLSTLISQTANEVRLEFNNELDDIHAYIRFVNGNIILGVEDSPFQVITSNNKISFMDTGNEVAYVANNQFLTPHQVVQSVLDLGGYRLDASDGLAFKWKGRG